MTSPATRISTTAEAYQVGGAMLFLALAVILAAFGFEHIGGYVPCPLCLQQRYAYYAGVPCLFAGLVLLSAGYNRWAALVFLAVALFFLANTGLGVYQAGAEWKFWAGPSTCATSQPISGSAADFMKSLQNSTPVRCDEAAWRLFGLSFAGWNAVISLVLFAGCLKSASAATPRN